MGPTTTAFTLGGLERITMKSSRLKNQCRFKQSCFREIPSSLPMKKIKNSVIESK